MLKKSDISKLFNLLNGELKKDNVSGELYLVGGAVMCLAFAARPSTRDVDAYFVPAAKVRAAAARVAIAKGLDDDWLNDGVKGFLSANGQFEPYVELSNLKVFCASAEYLLAMKCLAMRIGEEFHDLEDVRYLLKNLGISKYDKAVSVIAKFYPIDKIPQKSLYVLEELLHRS
jgi:hypothetical protein